MVSKTIVPRPIPERYKEEVLIIEAACEERLSLNLPRNSTLNLGKGVDVPSSPVAEFKAESGSRDYVMQENKQENKPEFKPLKRIRTKAICWPTDKMSRQGFLKAGMMLQDALYDYFIFCRDQAVEKFRKEHGDLTYRTVRSIPELSYSYIKDPDMEMIWLSLICGVERV